jgi:CO/xanthine dehydrogenase FAD-binding subunit
MELGSVQIRNRATLAGNFINNAHCADSVPALLVYDAVLTIQSFHHKRKISLKDFLVKPYQTQLKPTEIVTKIKLPLLHDDYIGDFYKLGRRRGVAISRITMALLMKINEDVISDIRFASGAVSPIGLRFEELEAAVRGNKITENLYKDMARQVGRKILDITKLRWSSAYKVPVLQQMVYQLFQRIYPTK